MVELTMRPLRLTTLFNVLKMIDEYESVHQQSPFAEEIRIKLKSGRGISEMSENRMNEIMLELKRLEVINLKKINDDKKVLELSDIGKKIVDFYNKNDAKGINKILYLQCKPYRYIVDTIKTHSLLKVFQYLFSWDDVPGKDSEKLTKFLRDDLNIHWTENAEICKSSDGKTIRISSGEDSAEIMLIDDQKKKKKKAILRFSDGRTYDLKVKKKNDKMNLYISPLGEKLEVEMTDTVMDNCLQWGDILGTFQFFIGNSDEKIVYDMLDNNVYYQTFVKSLEKKYWEMVKQKGDRLIELNRLREETCRELKISREFFRKTLERYYRENPQKISLSGAPPSLDIGGEFRSKIKTLHERVDYQEGISISGIKRKYIEIETE